MDYNKMAQEVHEENKIKGFYDVEPSKDMSLLLIVSELMEMVEADRKDLRADMEGFTKKLEKYPKHFGIIFNYDIKDTIEDEAADVIIRILDYAGWQGVDLNQDEAVVYKEREASSLSNECWITIEMIDAFRNSKNDDCYLCVAFSNCLQYFSKGLNIDIWKHVELKRKYNKLRPIRNGKKY